MKRCIMIACLLGLMILGAVCALADDGRLIDHGVAVPLAECRGVVTTQTEDGHCLAIACSLDLSPRGWILVTDIDSGQTQQVSCPEGIANAAPYGSMLASTGKFYTAQGRVLLEFDPDSSEWTFQGTPSKKVGAYLWMTEAPDGVIWCGGYGGAGLTSFNPQTREMADHGLMDDKEQYLSAWPAATTAGSTAASALPMGTWSPTTPQAVSELALYPTTCASSPPVRCTAVWMGKSTGR